MYCILLHLSEVACILHINDSLKKVIHSRESKSILFLKSLSCFNIYYSLFKVATSVLVDSAAVTWVELSSIASKVR